MRLVLLLVALSVGCGTANVAVDASARSDGGRGSGATCPTGSTLTYASFGEAFFTTYCTRCHDSSLVGAERMGAPVDHDFDTLVGIEDEAVHIDQQAAIGDNRANRTMPPNGMAPTDEERRQLGEWLACGAPP